MVGRNLLRLRDLLTLHDSSFNFHADVAIAGYYFAQKKFVAREGSMSDEISKVLSDMIKIFIALALLVIAVIVLYKDPFL